MKQMGVQDVSISQNSPWKSLNIILLTVIMQYKWGHPKSSSYELNRSCFFVYIEQKFEHNSAPTLWTILEYASQS